MDQLKDQKPKHEAFLVNLKHMLILNLTYISRFRGKYFLRVIPSTDGWDLLFTGKVCTEKLLF